MFMPHFPGKILVIEDSVNTGEIEKQILQAYGYQVDIVHDGVEALEQGRTAAIC